MQSSIVAYEGTDPEPDESVRITFRKGSMPLSLGIVEGETIGPELHRRQEDVTQAIIYDPQLLAPAVTHGKSTHVPLRYRIAGSQD